MRGARLFFWAGVLLAASGLGAEEARSPLTGRLLYSRLTDGTWQIWRRDLATDERIQVTSSRGDKRYPSWTRDGQVIYHTSNETCHRTGNGGRPDEPLLSDLWPVRDVAVSPDGARIAFSKVRTDLVDSANLWIADSGGKERRMLTAEAGLQHHPAWSPDGSLIAYVGGHGHGTYDLYVIQPDGSGQRRLTEDRAHEFLPAWSPDGSRIAFSSDVMEDYEIWVIRADGSGAEQLTQSPGLDTRPVWSPDGTRIAFATRRSGALEIWAMNADGSDPQPLIQEDGAACDPAWR